MFSSKGRRITALVGFGITSAIVYYHYKQNSHTIVEQEKGKKRKVAVIGAGVSGIVATKWLVAAGHEVKTFEQSNGVGGNWRYIEEGGEEHSSCYKNLTTITSANSMSLEGYPMPKSYGTYPHHTKIFKYLNYYCDENQLWNNFLLNTKVTSVCPVEGGYNVSYSTNGVERTELFEAVAVCNGHNAQPYWPSELETELKNFSGTVLHSRNYRNPSQFKGKNVLILGGGVSGKQIAFDISHQANLVALSSRRPINVSEIYVGKPAWRSVAKLFGATMQINPALEENPFSGKTVKFSNGLAVDIDAIIVCTGYTNVFPFLESKFVETLIRYPENSIHPAHLFLYKQTFPIFPGMNEYPTLAFIGMMDVYDSSMFPVSDIQAKWFAMLLSEKTRLPSPSQIESEMDQWVKSINLHYHPMTIYSPSLFREQILKLIEDNKT